LQKPLTLFLGFEFHVLGSDGQIVAEIVLVATQTKGEMSKVVWFDERIRKELEV
jgi:hypothetical protein